MASDELWTTSQTNDELVGSPVRAGVQLIGAVGVLALLAVLLPGPGQVGRALLGQDRSIASVGDEAMLVSAAVLVWLLLIWVLVAAAVALLGRVPGSTGRLARRALRRMTPAILRNVVLTVVGTSVLTGVAACAAPRSAAAAVAPVRSGIAVEGSAIRFASNSSALIDIDWPADRPVAARAASRSVRIDVDWPMSANAHGGSATERAPAAAATVNVDWPRPESSRSSSADSGVVVHRGDSLWAIAARHLPAQADVADVETAWHQWYSANKAVIGNDPNVILPGQILLPPNPGTSDPS